MRRLGDVGGGSAGFTLQKMNASAKQQPTYQEMLRKNHFESEDVYLSDEDGYRVLTYHSSGGFVGVAEQVTALDGGPLMFTCNFPLDVLVCDVIEQLPPTISRDISVHAQDGFIGRQVKVARELADDLLAAMRSNSTP